MPGNSGKRASPGQGHLKQAPSGRWHLSIQLNHKRYFVSGATRTEARRKRDALIARHRAGTLGDPLAGHTRLDAYLRDWLVGKRPSITTSSWLAYRSVVETHLAPGTLGRRQLASLTSPDIRRYYATLTSRGLSPASVRLQRAVLRQALQQAVDDGLLARNPAVGVRTPRQPRQELVILTAQEVASLLEMAPEGMYRTLWTLAAYTGLRDGELGGLLWRDLDLDRGVVSVQRGLVDGEGGRRLLQDEPKRRSSIRQVRILPEVVALLRVYRQEQRLARLAAGRGWLDRRGLVFTTETGLPLRRHTVGAMLHRTAARAGVAKRVTMHAWRHAYASHLLAEGRPITEVARLLGHASPAITLRVYAHAVPDVGEEAAEAIGRAYQRA